MARCNITVPHRLAQVEALRRIQNEIEVLKAKYGEKITGLRDGWNNNRYVFQGSAMGFAVSGAVRVTPLQVEIDGDLPLLAMPFRGRIEATIRERMGIVLA